jgi:hypothetical protein
MKLKDQRRIIPWQRGTRGNKWDIYTMRGFEIEQEVTPS